MLRHRFHGKGHGKNFSGAEQFFFGKLWFCSNFAESSFSCSCWPCLWLLRPVLKRKFGSGTHWVMRCGRTSCIPTRRHIPFLAVCAVRQSRSGQFAPPAGHPGHSFAAWQCGRSYRALAESCPGRQGRFERPRSAHLVHLPPGADPERALRASLRSSRGNADPCFEKNNFS